MDLKAEPSSSLAENAKESGRMVNQAACGVEAGRAKKQCLQDLNGLKDAIAPIQDWRDNLHW
eukprot:scaffold139775_cov28-Tisochrysis_lutea.AAC.2